MPLMGNSLLARKVKVEINMRCDYDNMVIEKGKFATQVIGDPKYVKAQGTYHGRGCYESALSDYNKKVKEMQLQEEAENGE